ncbi:hypothetical protein WJX77_000903 [Trebouxia sp. C0004]
MGSASIEGAIGQLLTAFETVQAGAALAAAVLEVSHDLNQQDLSQQDLSQQDNGNRALKSSRILCLLLLTVHIAVTELAQSSAPSAEAAEWTDACMDNLDIPPDDGLNVDPGDREVINITIAELYS